MRTMSKTTHGSTPHCVSMLSIRHTILDSWLPFYSRRSAIVESCQRSLGARLPTKTNERQTDGTDSDHRAARGSLWRRVWLLPRRLLPPRRTRGDRRHTRVDPGRGPLALSFEGASLGMA